MNPVESAAQTELDVVSVLAEDVIHVHRADPCCHSVQGVSYRCRRSE